MKKKKVICILGGIIAIVVLLCSTACLIDRNRVRNNNEPIFSYKAGGGSLILYIGPGYIIQGAYDGGEGGLPGAKFHTWVWFGGKIIYEEFNSHSGIQENVVNNISKDEGILEEEIRKSRETNSPDYIKLLDSLSKRGTGKVVNIEPVEVATADEQYIKIYAYNEKNEIVWDYQTQKEMPFEVFKSVEYIETDFWDNKNVIINDLGVLKVLDLDTGKTKWSLKYNGEVNVGTYDHDNIYLYSAMSNIFTVVSNDGKIIKTIDIAKAEKENNINEPCDKSGLIGIGKEGNNIVVISCKHTDEEETQYDEEKIYIDLNNWSVKIDRESHKL